MHHQYLYTIQLSVCWFVCWSFFEGRLTGITPFCINMALSYANRFVHERCVSSRGLCVVCVSRSRLCTSHEYFRSFQQIAPCTRHNTNVENCCVSSYRIRLLFHFSTDPPQFVGEGTSSGDILATPDGNLHLYIYLCIAHWCTSLSTLARYD